MKLREMVPWKRGQEDVTVHRESPAFELQDRINHLFDDFFRGFGGLGAGPWGTSPTDATPRVDVSETEERVRVEAELPGLDEKDVELTLSGDALVLRGEKKAERKDEKEGWHTVERTFGSFRRVIPLPAEVEADGVEATFSRGVLTVELPKSKTARERSRKIRIEAR